MIKYIVMLLAISASDTVVTLKEVRRNPAAYCPAPYDYCIQYWCGEEKDQDCVFGCVDTCRFPEPKYNGSK